MDENKLSRIAGIHPSAARIALSEGRWKKWLDERKEENDTRARLANLHMVSGIAVNENKFPSDRELIVEMYEDYLRMAQMDQRSLYTEAFVNGRRENKKVIDMTFVEYLRDGLKNLDWRKNKDLPQLRRLEDGGGIGVSEREAEISKRIADRVAEVINRYLSMSETEQLIYV
jgi:hypothetical protein